MGVVLGGFRDVDSSALECGFSKAGNRSVFQIILMRSEHVFPSVSNYDTTRFALRSIHPLEDARSFVLTSTASGAPR